MSDLKAQFQKIAEEAEAEFAKDGGLDYTRQVMQYLDVGSLTFDARRACVKLALLHNMVLQEYGSLVSQLESAGTKIVELPPKGKS